MQPQVISEVSSAAGQVSQKQQPSKDSSTPQAESENAAELVEEPAVDKKEASAAAPVPGAETDAQPRPCAADDGKHLEGDAAENITGLPLEAQPQPMEVTGEPCKALEASKRASQPHAARLNATPPTEPSRISDAGAEAGNAAHIQHGVQADQPQHAASEPSSVTLSCEEAAAAGGDADTAMTYAPSEPVANGAAEPDVAPATVEAENMEALPDNATAEAPPAATVVPAPPSDADGNKPEHEPAAYGAAQAGKEASAGPEATGPTLAADGSSSVEALKEEGQQTAAQIAAEVQNAVKDQPANATGINRTVEEEGAQPAVAASPPPGNDHPGHQSPLAAAAGALLLGKVGEGASDVAEQEQGPVGLVRASEPNQAPALPLDATSVLSAADGPVKDTAAVRLPAAGEQSQSPPAQVPKEATVGVPANKGAAAAVAASPAAKRQNSPRLVDPTAVMGLHLVIGAAPANGVRSASPKLFDPTKRLGAAVPRPYALSGLVTSGGEHHSPVDEPRSPTGDHVDDDLWGSLLVDSPPPCKFPPKPEWSQPASVWRQSGSG